MRKCKECENSFEVKEFPKADKKAGIQYYRHLCSKCYVKQKKIHRQSRRKWFTAFKKTLFCNRCGNNNYRVLEFHHKGDKDFTISNAIAYSKEKIMKEVAKCEVLCANCHRIEHYPTDL